MAAALGIREKQLPDLMTNYDSRGSFLPFFTRPVSCILLLLAFAFIFNAIFQQVRDIRAKKAVETGKE